MRDVQSASRSFWTAWGLSSLGGLVVAGLFLALVPRPYPHAGLSYQGAESCRACHEARYEWWSASPMANSFALLLPGQRAASKLRAGLDPHADYSHDSRCLGCHATGAGLVGGFSSLAETPGMAGVTCEACHGPGGRYAGTRLSPGDGAIDSAHQLPPARFHDVGDAACERCHNEASPFAGRGHGPTV